MQGGTVERAFVVASPEDLTAGWSYSALSRARGDTRLLIADLDRRGAERAELAPREARPTTGRSDVLATVAWRMLVRDDEDLAVDQIRAAGREDDPAVASHRAARGNPAQEVAADRAQANVLGVSHWTATVSTKHSGGIWSGTRQAHKLEYSAVVLVRTE